MAQTPSRKVTEAEGVGWNPLHRSSDRKEYPEQGEIPHVDGGGGRRFNEGEAREMPSKLLDEDSLAADWELVLAEEDEDGFVLIENQFPR